MSEDTALLLSIANQQYSHESLLVAINTNLSTVPTFVQNMEFMGIAQVIGTGIIWGSILFLGCAYAWRSKHFS